jgi:hypothetical protein
MTVNEILSQFKALQNKKTFFHNLKEVIGNNKPLNLKQGFCRHFPVSIGCTSPFARIWKNDKNKIVYFVLNLNSS